MSVASIDSAIEMVMREQYESYQRGMLSVWTIYKGPRDWPHGYIVRKHEAGKDGSMPTNITMETASLTDEALNLLRHVLSNAGLVNTGRQLGDDVNIVESWI